MPQTRSAYKRLRQNKKKHLWNKTRVTEIRTLIKRVRVLLAKKNAKEAEVALQALESRLDKAAQTSAVKKTTASRKISRLRKQIHQTTVKKK